MTRTSTLARTRDERGVVTITVDDAPTRNALSTAVLAEFDQCLAELAGDSSARVLVLTGAGTVFSSGADRAELGDPAAVARSTDLLSSVLARIEDSTVPVVARVNGAAFGAGLAVAAAADISVAVSDAVFGLPEVRFGFVAGPAAATCVARMGRTAALDLLLTGRRFDPAEALRVGLVTSVADRADLDAAVQAVVADLLAGDYAALAATRRLVRQLTPPALADRLTMARGLAPSVASGPGAAL